MNGWLVSCTLVMVWVLFRREKERIRKRKDHKNPNGCKTYEWRVRQEAQKMKKKTKGS